MLGVMNCYCIFGLIMFIVLMGNFFVGVFGNN